MKWSVLLFLFLLLSVLLLLRKQTASTPITTLPPLPAEMGAPRRSSSEYQGLVLFDVDGTLTSGRENTAVVTLFLRRGWAVGIATAGSLYTPTNIHQFDWMPSNLLAFLQATQFRTFHNVAASPPLLHGRPSSYAEADRSCPPQVDGYGFRKGHAMVRTANLLDIPLSRTLLCDDLIPFVAAVKAYHPQLQTIHNPEGLSLQRCTEFLDRFKDFALSK